MKIIASRIADMEVIFQLYDRAVEYQKLKGAVPWPKFDRKLIESEIQEQRQWKIIVNNQIVCVWAITESDPQIWEEKNEDPSIYIHRIATRADFRGRNLVKEMVVWAKSYAQQRNKHFLRMDTVGENKGLIQYYKKCGFEFLGLRNLKNTTGLPLHYQDAQVCLFQMKISEG